MNTAVLRRGVIAVTAGVCLLAAVPADVSAKRGMPDFVVETGCGEDNSQGSMVLIAIATNYGRTFKVAEAIAAVLCAEGFQVDIRFAAGIAAEDLDPYDTVILGSCIYVEHWHDDALAFLASHESILAAKNVAYYCVNMLQGTKIEGAAEMVDEYYLQPMYEQFPQITPLDVIGFAGAVDYRILTPKDWWSLRLFLIPGGDWTDWEGVDAWAETIAAQLD